MCGRRNGRGCRRRLLAERTQSLDSPLVLRKLCLELVDSTVLFRQCCLMDLGIRGQLV